MALFITHRELKHAYDVVRRDLDELGLRDAQADDEGYLTKITVLPAWWLGVGMLAFTFDRGVSWYDSVIGFEDGTIYVPRLLTKHGSPFSDMSLINVLRHEIGHAWAWLDPAFFREPW